MENAKKYFRIIASDYELDDDNNLFIKYYDKKSSLAKVNKTLKKYLNYKLCKIPFVQDLNSFIYNIHKNLLHRNNKDLQKELIKKNIFFKGITKVIKNVCTNCKICNLKKNTKFYKKERAKILIFNQPKIRYVSDLTDVPSDLSHNSKFKYILNIVDHFFKFCQGYLLINKNKESILEIIKNFLILLDCLKSSELTTAKNF